MSSTHTNELHLDVFSLLTNRLQGFIVCFMLPWKLLLRYAHFWLQRKIVNTAETVCWWNLRCVLISEYSQQRRNDAAKKKFETIEMSRDQPERIKIWFQQQKSVVKFNEVEMKNLRGILGVFWCWQGILTVFHSLSF